MLELLKAILFFLDIVLLYGVAIRAFFVPGSGWEERLDLVMARLVLAAGACLLSGLLFSLTSKPGSRSVRSFFTTLPLQLFLWGLGAIAVLFFSGWYLDSYPCTMTVHRNCSW